MDTILVVNAGSSSVKFQVFARTGAHDLKRLIKGQIDGVGSLPRLCANAADGALLVDQKFSAEKVSDLPAAMQTAGAWLLETQEIAPVAVGHRVVHGGPNYDRPILIDDEVLKELEALGPLAPLHQPNNLAPIR